MHIYLSHNDVRKHLFFVLMEAYKFKQVVNSLSGLNQSLQNILSRLNQDIVVVNRHLQEKKGMELSANIHDNYESPNYLVETVNKFQN